MTLNFFVEDEDALKDNYNSVISFVKHLETTDRGEGKHGEKSLVWRNVPFETICDELLDKFIFHEKLKTFDNLEAVKSWVKEMQDKGRLTDWNVVLFGSGSGGDGVLFMAFIRKTDGIPQAQYLRCMEE